MLSHSKFIKSIDEHLRIYEKTSTQDELKLDTEKSFKTKTQSKIAIKMAELGQIQSKSKDSLPLDIQSMIDARDESLKTFENALSKTELTISGLYAEVDQKKTQLEALAKSVDAALKNNEEYVKLAEKKESIETEIAEKSMMESQLSNEFEGKLLAYENSNVYQYLKAQKEGGRSNKVSKYFHDMISSWTDFEKNYINEHLLKDALIAIEKVKSERKDALVELNASIKKLKLTFIKALKFDDLSAEIISMEKNIDHEKSKANICRNNIRLITENRDDAYADITNKITKSLKLKTISELEEMAKKTITEQDDAIVSEIKVLFNQLRDSETKIYELERIFSNSNKAFLKAQEFKKKMKSISSDDYEFKKSLDINNVMSQYMADDISLKEATSYVMSKREEVSRDDNSYFDNSYSSSRSSGSSSSPSFTYFDLGGSSSSDSYSSSDSSSSYSSSSSSDSFSTSDSF